MRKPDEHISPEDTWLMRSYGDKQEKGANIKASPDESSGLNPVYPLSIPPTLPFDSLENQKLW